MATKVNDMNRVGLFQEMSYITVQDPYVSSAKCNSTSAASKGKQMLPGPVKERVTGLQDGYFTKPFPRVFEKEAYSDPIARRRQERVQAAKKNITNKPFITFKGEIRPEGLGSNFGTFSGKQEYFSRKEREQKPHEHEKPNVKTNPSKKGTGYGYSTVGLDKYPEYKGDKYNATDLKSKEEYEAHKKAQIGTAFLSGKYHKVLFDKNVYLTEKDGAVNKEISRSKSDPSIKPFKPSSPPKTLGNKDGFFTEFPKHQPDPWKVVSEYKPIKRIVNNSGKLFTPQQGPKSKPQNSVVNQNVGIKINAKTYKQANSYSTYNLPAISAH